MKKFLLILLFICFLFSCGKKEVLEEKSKLKTFKYKDTYKVIIIMDTVDDWSSKTKIGYQEELDKILKERSSKAHYTVYNTKLKKEEAEKILLKVKEANADIICTINYPDSFADINISKKLIGDKYKIVSMNPVPTEAGIIETWNKPNGNITGVGVFLKFNSVLRLMKLINPKAKKMFFYSWDAMTLVNKWFEKEVKRASKEENLQLIEFSFVSHQEELKEHLKKIDKLNQGNNNYFALIGIIPFVHKDGSYADDVEFTDWITRNTKLSQLSYEETDIENGMLAGASIVWGDIGAQLAEKTLLIFEGKNPGEISWSYPRKNNMMINLKRAKTLGFEISEELIGAAYRVYTDYDGHYLGQN